MTGVETDPTNPNNPKMYSSSYWIPPNLFTPVYLRERMSAFKAALKSQYKPRRCRNNLVPHQQHALNSLRNQDEFLIVQCDTKLGPAIIEKQEYIQLALTHLTNTTTYRRLNPLKATMYLGQIRQTITSWINHNKTILTKNEETYLNRSLAQCIDPFGAFYLLMKVHKVPMLPMSTRAIMYASGTLLFALGVWTDIKLQPFAIRQRSYFKSSQVLKTQLNDVVVPPNSFLFTADAVSMYTNIPTDQALTLICNHIRATAHLIPDVPVEALCSALRIVMRCNIFSFGDTLWCQISGTAMGCPPAPPWANTFFGLFEAILLPIFQDNLSLFKRFIDDVNWIWTIQNPTTNNETWEQFKLALNDDASALQLITIPPSQVVDFMDMTLSTQHNRITTTLYEKPSNYHLYIPPHSCHPPGLLRGMVYGMVNRLHTLVSGKADRDARNISAFRHLQRSRYQPRDIHPLFSSAITKAEYRTTNPPPPIIVDPEELRKMQFFHIEYHPMNMPARTIQSLWRNYIAAPPNKIPLSEIIGHNCAECGIDRLIVAHHRPPSLGNLLSYRKLKPNYGPPVSSYL
jgi:hypothetical protein